MTTPKTLLHSLSPSLAFPAAFVLAALLGLAACGGNPPTDGDDQEGPDETTAAPSDAAEDPAADAGEVSYEPAYPEDVSDEDLTAADMETQEGAHSHGDEGAHSHDGTEDHEHGEDEGHDHGDGDDDDHQH